MNERIKELAAQAGMNIVDDKFSTYGKFAEKFAELIVRECASQVIEHQPRYLTRGQAQEMANTIKEHFGAEE